MSIFGSDFTDLRQRLGLDENRNNGIDFSGYSRFGVDYLRSREGAEGLFQYATKGLPQTGVANGMKYNFLPVYRDYQMAAAADDTLQFDQFLNKYDFNKAYNAMDLKERGENPAAFTRPGGYRLFGL